MIRLLVQSEDGTPMVMSIIEHQISGRFYIDSIEPVKTSNFSMRPLWLTLQVQSDVLAIWNSHEESTGDHKRVAAIKYLREEAEKQGYKKPGIGEAILLIRKYCL
jgi:hypothetical protein